MLQILPLKFNAGARYVRRLAFGPGTLESVASDVETICPLEEAEVRETTCLPGQIDRITGASVFATVKSQIKHVTDRIAIHAPTLAYHLSGATLYNGNLYCHNFKLPAANDSKTNGSVQLTSAALASSYIGSQFFGHWLRDDCSRYLLAETYGKPLTLDHSDYGHAPTYAEMFGQDWTPTTGATIDHLVVFQDHAQNSNKKKRYHTLRREIRDKVSPARTPLVYLCRGNTGHPRKVANERALIDELVRRGFSVADVGTDNLEDILAKIAGAKLVLSMEGSHLNHCCMSLSEGSALLVLQPADRFSANFKGWADAVDIRSGFVVGPKFESGYHFEIDEILKTMELLSA
jgi:hypothetical protein